MKAEFLVLAKEKRTTASVKAPYRVMVVDDSAVIRGLMMRMLENDPDVEGVASVANGKMAITALEKQDVDIIILDIEMPIMNGMEALPKLLEVDPKVQIVIYSTLTTKNADISLKALANGAADYINKPSSSREISGGDRFKQELLDKIKALGKAHRHMSGRRSPASALAKITPKVTSKTPPKTPSKTSLKTPSKTPSKTIANRKVLVEERIVLREKAGNSLIPDAIAIGSSTGGPQALFEFLGSLSKSNVKQPIFITQHMPATFTKILAGHIARITGRDAKEAVDGEIVKKGVIYVAPGDFHMVIKVEGTDIVLRLLQTPPLNFCRPSVDPMFESIAKVYGKKVLAIVLTGMGNDGTNGAGCIAHAGGFVIAQDEATSVVWGMPGSVARAGVCSAILPIKKIAPYVDKIVTGQK